MILFIYASSLNKVSVITPPDQPQIIKPYANSLFESWWLPFKEKSLSELTERL